MRTKTTTMEPQPEVTIKTYGQTVQIQIYLFGREVVIEREQGQEPRRQLEYDFAEIRVPVGFLDLDDVQASPEKYLDYEYDEAMAYVKQLKQKLSAEDYVGTKIAMGRATREQYADVITLCDKWAAEVNRLMAGGVPNENTIALVDAKAYKE